MRWLVAWSFGALGLALTLMAWAQVTTPPRHDVILTDVERVQAYAAELKRDRDAKELQVSDLRALGAKAQADLDKLRQDVEAIKATLAEMTAKRDGLTKDLEAARAAQTAAEAATAEAQARAAACARRHEGGGR